MECDNKTPEDSKRNLPLVLPTMAGLMERMRACACVCVRACMQGSCFEGD
jgi:hypothetical protein